MAQLNSHSLDLEQGSSQYAYITDANQTGLDITGDMSVLVWVNLESLPGAGDFHWICGKEDRQATSRRGYFMWVDQPADIDLAFAFFDSSGNFTRGDTDWTLSAGSLGTWYHLAVVVDVSVPSIIFYRDGSLISSVMTHTAATSINDTSEPFTVGASLNNGTPDRFWDGKIDELRVYDRVLTAAEIQHTYLKQLDSIPSGLQGYWRFNNDYTDETANGNDLTSSGSPVFSTDVPFKGRRIFTTHQ